MTNIDQPLVSVIIPSLFNNHAHFREMIASLNRQTYMNFEVLILLDGNPGRETQLLAVLGEATFQYRVLVSQKQRGVSRALNILARFAKGALIARMDDDDICHPERFKTQVRSLINSNVDVLGTGVGLIDQRGQSLKTTRSGFDFRAAPKPYDLLFGDLFFHPSVMFRKAWWRQHQYNRSWKYGEDRELWIRSIHCSVFSNLPDQLLYYRVRQVGHSSYRKALKNKIKLLSHFRSIFSWRRPFFYALIKCLELRAISLYIVRRT